MTAAIVEPVVTVDPEASVERPIIRAHERGDVTLRAARPDMCPPVRNPQFRARCPLHPCPSDSTFVAVDEGELAALYEAHRAESHPREDRPR